MKRLKLNLLMLFCLSWIGFSCQDENIGDYPPSNMRSIVRFTLNPAQNGGNIFVQHVATIDQSLKIIKLELPDDVDLRQVKPEITISPWAQVTPQSLEEIDLSGNIEYTIVSESGKKAVYSVETVFTYKYTGAEIYAITFPDIISPATGKSVKGIFEGNIRSLTVKVPKGTNITQLTPQFDISPASQHATFDNPPGKSYDFSEPVSFTITSENEANSVVYTIAVEIE